MGRIKMSEQSDVRKAMINFSMSQNEKRDIAAAAEKMGLSMSAYIRYKVLYEKKEV